MKTPGRRFIPFCCLAVALVNGWSPAANASRIKEAKISQVAGDVKTVSPADIVQPAVADAVVPEGASIRSGENSRGEIVFANELRSRMGAGTSFKFRDGSRHLQLEEGVLLVDAPRKAGRVEIETANVHADVTHTTAVFEVHANAFKFLVLQGTARLFRPGHLGDSVLVGTGQMVIGNPAVALSDAVDFDVDRFVKTCRLIKDFGPLGNEKLLAKESQKQLRDKGKKKLYDTNLVIFGEGSRVSLVDTDVPAVPNDQGHAAPPQQVAPPASSLGLNHVDYRAGTISH